MINRTLLTSLRQWKESSGRKPLILRGARQVGKTTLVREFAKEYEVFLSLNLENEAERQLFEDYQDVHELITAIYFFKGVRKSAQTALLFIDEIQFSRRAVAILRYFYEEANDLHVIVAGSLLETVIDVRRISFPVGRVQYMAVRPCSFLEFLDGTDNRFDADLIQQQPEKTEMIHTRLMKSFRNYTLVGGMPAAISLFAQTNDVLAVREVYESLVMSYKEDVEKYTANPQAVKVIRTLLDIGWQQAAEIISFEHFGGTNYSSKDISQAFQTIQKAMLLELVYPTSAIRQPLLLNFRMRPKLIWLDTGLVNFVADTQRDVFFSSDIQDIWRGRIAEQIVAQELLTLDHSLLSKRVYWKREKRGSEAEIDFLYNYEGMVIPVEVKAGHNSKLKSLHLFMTESPYCYAIRVWSQPLSVDEVATPGGKTFSLINLPFYLVGVVDKVLKQLIKKGVP